MTHASIEDICIAWRLWDLPLRTHSRFQAPICNLFSLNRELMCYCASFIVKSLQSVNTAVKFIARNGVLFRQMLSPIGHNAFYCSSYRLSVCDLHHVSKQRAWYETLQSDIRSADVKLLIFNVSF